MVRCGYRLMDCMKFLGSDQEPSDILWLIRVPVPLYVISVPISRLNSLPHCLIPVECIDVKLHLRTDGWLRLGS